MKTIFQKSFLALAIIFTIYAITGCLKGDFDNPPSNIPEIKNEQIWTFDQMLGKIVTGKITNIQEDKYLEALVVADDASGNIFKSLILKDMKGEKGISMSIDENELHTLYPVGQVVYISLKDLAIGYYEGLPTLGVNSGATVGRIPASLVRSIIIKSGRTAPVEPLKVKFSELNNNLLNRLIQLEGMQFETATSTTTYADANPANPQSLNHNLVDCNKNKLILRNSGFAKFAGQVVPQGNGTIVCVFSYFRNAPQLLIRDVTDISFTGERCGGGGTTGTRISIKDLRDMYKGSDVNLASGFIQGIVISDVANKNINGQNMIIQDGDYGVLVRFKAAINVPLNAEVKVSIKDGLLSAFNGLLQLQNLDNQGVEVLNLDKPITPKVLTISQIDLKQHESTLVKIQNASLSGGSKYDETTIKLKDASGEVSFFTNKAATFATQPLATGNLGVTAIVSNFNGKQLSIRNLSDITGGTPCDLNDPNADCDGDGVVNGKDCAPQNPLIYPGAPCDDGDPNTTGDKYDDNCICKGTPGTGGSGINESFDTQTNDVDISIPGWANVVVKGDRKWRAKYFATEKNFYAQATAFGNGGPAEMETWLITPTFDTDKASDFSLKTSFQAWKHDGLSIWVTTNYTGDPSTTTWQEVKGLRIATNGDTEQQWIPSGTVNLKQYGKNLRIGFKHVGSQSKNTTSYRIDDIIVK